MVADKKGRGSSSGEKPSRKKRPGGPESHVSAALKTAYDEAVREDIPDEFIDLLGKLS